VRKHLKRWHPLTGLLCFAGLAILSGAVRNTQAAAGGASSSWGFAPSNLDKTCKPCEDFYQFAMGGWMKSNPIPAEYPNWGTFTVLADQNQTSMRNIVEAAANAKAAPGSNEQKIGDFYASCMDTTAIDAAGIKPLASDLAAISAIQDRSALEAEIAALQREGVRTLFNFDSAQDFKDSSKVIGAARQGGLGLPDRDYYVKDDERSQQIRAGYVEHMAKMFALAGDSAEQSAGEAQTVMSLEGKLASASMTRTQRRDPKAVYHIYTRAQLKELTPDWSWEGYFRSMSVPVLSEINVSQPDFFKTMDSLLTGTGLDNWKTYLRWHLLHSRAPALSEPFVQENFNFFSKQLSGAQEIQPRWKRCVQAVNGNLGEALGEVYVRKYFPPEAKAHAREMVQNLIAALRADLPTLSWMGPETRKAAIEKLEAFGVKIGYTDKWRDYSGLSVDRGAYLANLARADQFETTFDLGKIGKPLDKTEWGMTPPTVNAYYSPNRNEIVFPAGILQPPFYDVKADDAVNYGGMGAVIGHEITHGFDDQGSQFDEKGNFRNWWTAEDRKNFDERTDCVKTQFDGFEAEPGLHLNGKLVLGESIADLGGLTISYAAYEKSLEGKTRPKDLDGFTPEQRFFLGWAQVWGSNVRPEFARLQTNTNEHPLPRFRVNGPLSNMAAFAQAFGCKKGDAMVREQACKIW
jgi:putative endopeptidase